jgi:hypothetical protein
MATVINADAAERRRLPREKILKSGVIVYGRDRQTMDCMLVNYSEEGAKIRPLDPLVLPQHFELLLGRSAVYFCEFLRRTGCDVAVRFVARGIDKPEG